MPEPHTTAFSDAVSQLTFYISTWECGCWHEEGFDAAHELQHLRFQVCPSCWDHMATYLDNLALDTRAQLTLSLPLAKGDRERF